MAVEFQWTTWRYIPEDGTLYTTTRFNLDKSSGGFKINKIFQRNALEEAFL
jgi:hypothetical protein